MKVILTNLKKIFRVFLKQFMINNPTFKMKVDYGRNK